METDSFVEPKVAISPQKERMGGRGRSVSAFRFNFKDLCEVNFKEQNFPILSLRGPSRGRGNLVAHGGHEIASPEARNDNRLGEVLPRNDNLSSYYNILPQCLNRS